MLGWSQHKKLNKVQRIDFFKTILFVLDPMRLSGQAWLGSDPNFGKVLVPYLPAREFRIGWIEAQFSQLSIGTYGLMSFGYKLRTIL